MIPFAFLLKTYPKDYHYAIRLIDSFSKYNKEKIPIFVVLPARGEEVLSCRIKDASNVHFLTEEKFPYLVNESVWGLTPGYINQEIIKMSFWEKGLCRNYFCLDSDGIFIRDFYLLDFMHDEMYPYTVVYDDMELKSDPVYYNSYWKPREAALKKIQAELGFDLTEKIWTCHGFQIFNSEVLRRFKDEFMQSKGYSYADLMKISPYEFSWYNYYLQKSKAVPIYVTGPLFKTFHTKEQLIISCVSDIGIDELSKGYIGIVVNSNFTDGMEDVFDNLIHYHFDVSPQYTLFLLRESIRNCLRSVKHKMMGLLCRFRK